jgi:DNA invertase Pin-like site-specific DNA recombinase
MPPHKVRSRTAYANPKDYITEQIIKNGECWDWPGTPGKNGYPQTAINGKTTSLTRYVYELFIGPIPEGHSVCHTCDRPPCINPDHLFAGSHSDNMQDCLLKNRHPKWLSSDQVEIIKKRVIAGETYRQIASAFNISRETVISIAKHKTHAHVRPDLALPKRGGPILNNFQVKEIRTLLGAGVSMTEISERFGVSRRCIYSIRKNETWKTKQPPKDTYKSKKPGPTYRKHDDEIINQIRSLYSKGVSQPKIAKLFSISQPYVSLIVNHKTRSNTITPIEKTIKIGDRA